MSAPNELEALKARVKELEGAPSPSAGWSGLFSLVGSVVAIVPRWLVVAAGVVFVAWLGLEIYINAQSLLADLQIKRSNVPWNGQLTAEDQARSEAMRSQRDAQKWKGYSPAERLAKIASDAKSAARISIEVAQAQCADLNRDDAARREECSNRGSLKALSKADMEIQGADLSGEPTRKTDTEKGGRD